tara:strand:+ start:11032 stop:12060 length:1029 start_codon:yes stop_codon:yes gene_type:complete
MSGKTWDSIHYEVDTVLIDGLWGTGKSLLHPIVSTFQGLEDARLEEVFEYIAQLDYLSKIDKNSADWLIKTYLDLIMHSNLLGRHSNLRWSDDTGLKHSFKKIEKIKRLFRSEKNNLSYQAKKRKLGNVLMTHMVCCCPDVFFRSLNSRFFLIEIVRHPIHQLSHVVSYFSRFQESREKTLSFNIGEKKIPWFELNEYEKKNFYIKNNFDRAIDYLFNNYMETWDNILKFKKKGNNIIEVSFEELVLDTNLVVNRIENFLGREATKNTFKAIKKNRLPRKLIHQGFGYKKYGWKESSLNNQKFYTSCLDEIKKNASEEYLFKLLDLVKIYNKRYSSLLNNYQ